MAYTPTYPHTHTKRETYNFLPGMFTSLSVRPATLHFSHSLCRLSCPRYSLTPCLSSQANTKEGGKSVYTHFSSTLINYGSLEQCCLYCTSLSREVARQADFNCYSFILTSVTEAGHGADLGSHRVSRIISSSADLGNLPSRKEMEHRSGNSALGLVRPEELNAR